MEIPPDSAHFLTVVKTVLRLLGQTNRDLERHLELSGSYMSRLFSGDIELRFQHILDISRTLGLAPQELVMLAYPEILTPPTGEAALRLWSLLEPFKSPAEALGQVAPEAPHPALVQAVEGVVGALLQQRPLRAPAAELPAAWREAVPPPAEPVSAKSESRPRRRTKSPRRRAKPKR
ncbi:MAG TPA: hypothetical protein VFE33_23865 [Thermoanaerobaculia bacterium]|nr:hypothetical protein [Thermoanaerobaculia bacterium]